MKKNILAQEERDLRIWAEEFLYMQRRKNAAWLRMIARAKHGLELWEENRLLEKLRKAIKEKQSPKKIISYFKPRLERMGIWDAVSEELWYKYDKMLEDIQAHIEESVVEHPAWNWFSQVKGINFLLAAEIIGGFARALRPGEILAEHFEKVSQMWAFAGLNIDPETGKAPRRKIREKVSFCIELRSILVGRVATSLMMARGGYYEIYKKEKARLVTRFQAEGKKIVPAAQLPRRKDGKRYEPPGMISRGHVDRMARRIMAKILVSHLWEVLRESAGLPSGRAYVFDVLGHTNYIPPIRDKPRKKLVS